MEKKTCIKCGIEKDIGLFKKKTNRCMSCYALYRVEYYQKNKDKIREQYEAKKDYTPRTYNKMCNIDEEHIKCSRCEKIHPISEYDGWHTYCRKCLNDYAKVYNENKKTQKRHWYQYKQKNNLCDRCSAYRYKDNLCVDHYNNKYVCPESEDENTIDFSIYI